MHDILPPSLAHKVENTIRSLSGNDKKKTHKGGKPQPKKGRFPLAEILVGVVVIGALFGVYAYIKLPKADIEIWPKVDTLTLAEKITVDTAQVLPNTTAHTIPGRYVELQKSASQQFPVTGSASNDGQATGTITIYNKIDPASPFTLIKGTHFLSDSGQYFVTLEKVVVPAAQKKVPGSVNVKVQAEQSGSDYNIGPSKFSVPKLNGTAYYYGVYGESKAAMAGGHTGKVKKVTDDNIQGAKDVVTKNALDQAEASLKSSLAPDEVLLDGAVTNSVINASSDAKPDTVADTFNETVNVKISAIVFKKQDAEALINNNIDSQLSSDKNLLEKSLQITYTSEVPDAKHKTMVVDVNSSAKTSYQINASDLMDVIALRSYDQVKQVVDQMYDGKVSELKVNFWPFWVHSTPEDRSRITISVHVE